MKFASFMFFSSLEYIAFVYFILVLFRFQVREYIWKFVVFAIVLSFVSNTLQTESLRAVSPLIQAALMIAFVSFLLRIHLFHSVIMVITGYVINFIVSALVMMTVMHFARLDTVVPYTPEAYMIQSISALLMFLFGVVTFLQKGGFSFIYENGKLKKRRKFSKKDRPFVVFLALSVLFIFLSNLWFLLSEDPPYLLIAAMLFVALIGLVYLSVKRDGQQE